VVCSVHTRLDIVTASDSCTVLCYDLSPYNTVVWLVVCVFVCVNMCESACEMSGSACECVSIQTPLLSVWAPTLSLHAFREPFPPVGVGVDFMIQGPHSRNFLAKNLRKISHLRTIFDDMW